MSLEDQYDAWVRGLMGGKKYAATSKQAEEANDAVQQMQASLDALTAAQNLENAVLAAQKPGQDNFTAIVVEYFGENGGVR